MLLKNKVVIVSGIGIIRGTRFVLKGFQDLISFRNSIRPRLRVVQIRLEYDQRVRIQGKGHHNASD